MQVVRRNKASPPPSTHRGWSLHRSLHMFSIVRYYDRSADTGACAFDRKKTDRTRVCRSCTFFRRFFPSAAAVEIGWVGKTAASCCGSPSPVRESRDNCRRRRRVHVPTNRNGRTSKTIYDDETLGPRVHCLKRGADRRGGGGTLKNCTRVGQVRRRTCGLFISDPRWLHSGAIASPPEETRDKQTLDVDADITYIIIYTRLYCSLGSSRVALRAQVTWRKVVFPDNPFFEINNYIVQ